jgi:hypothetical protein
MRPPIFVLLALFAAATPASAGEPVDPAAWTYQIISARGKARLVQRCNGPAACETTTFDARRRRLWRTPQALGPLGGTALCDDGIHVVHVSELISTGGAAEAEAVVLYARGEVVRRWKLKEIVRQPDSLPERGGALRWVRDFRFRANDHQFELVLVSGERFSFSLATGERTR